MIKLENCEMPSVASKPVVENEAYPSWVKLAVFGGALAVTGIFVYTFFGPDEGGSRPNKSRKDKAKKKDESIFSKASDPSLDATTKHKLLVEDVPEDDEVHPTDPLEQALAAKNKGNKYFKGGKYDLAIRCYTEAIEMCPKDKVIDLSTFYQNRAAAYDQLEDLEMVISDCGRALKLNNKYVKALDRRAKANRKGALKEGTEYNMAVRKLRQSLLDITAVCILEGFQKQEHIMMVDSLLKELGRIEAKESVKCRKPSLTSKHFIQQYFQSFSEDPIMQSLGTMDMGDARNISDLRGYVKALKCLRLEMYEGVIPACNEELCLPLSDGSSSSSGPIDQSTCLLLRGTFYILNKQMEEAFADLEKVINDETAPVAVRVNALIKRASLFIQQCKDPHKDPELSLADFKRAEELNPKNADVYHHRGQVYLLIDQIDNAIADFKKAVELNPEFPIAYVQKLFTDYRKASMNSNLETINNIINLFEVAVEKFSTCVESYALFAQVLSDQQNYERADQLYVEAQQVDPGNANLLVHRGLIQLQWKADVVQAVELIKAATELDKKCEFAFETLGTIEVQRGNLADAVELFDRAIPLANTELEMAHLYGLREAAVAQATVSKDLGIPLPGVGPMI